MPSSKNIGVLAVQGAFAEHIHALRKVGANPFEIRELRDLDYPGRHLDALVLPGGESTVQGKLLRDLGLFEPLKESILAGLPTLGTCAGLILLANKLSNDNNVYFGALPITVKRNAYGRQLGSFHTEADFKPLGQIPMTFIRAPLIEEVQDGVKILAHVKTETESQVVAVQYGNILGVSFHPELTKNYSLHKFFAEMA